MSAVVFYLAAPPPKTAPGGSAMAGRPTNSQRVAAHLRRTLGSEMRTARLDAGITSTRLATAAGVSRSHLAAIEAGASDPSSDVLARLAEVLGVRVSVKVYPGTGPRLRDHIQAAIADALIRSLNNRWQRFAEVAVYRPVHGVIDLVLHDPGRRVLVAGEIQSELRRLEQLVRWSHEKRDALPSATFWGSAASDGQPTVSSLLVLRSSRMNRTIVNDHAALLQAIYPARAAHAVAALVGDLPWPGNALVWARVESGRAEILEGPPRGVQLGR